LRSLGKSAAPFLLLIFVGLIGCAAGPAPAGRHITSPSNTAEADIAEAVFRYQFDHNASAIQKRAEKYCLSLPGERMPNADFLKRFESHRPPVTAADQCERKTGKNLFFRILKLDWRNDNEVWVRGGYFEGNLSSSFELYRVLNENGKWVVKGARMEAIS